MKAKLPSWSHSSLPPAHRGGSAGFTPAPRGLSLLRAACATTLLLASVSAQAAPPGPSSPPPNPGPSTGAPGSAPDASGTNLEDVIVTGSALPQAGDSLPVTTITRDAIQRSGASTLTQVLTRLPQNSAGFTENVNPGTSFTPGAAGISLRGLKVSATLVLLNGRRLSPFPIASSGTDSFVDINSIPLAAVERIEVLKDGASAIYGSDAIAGVVNIITRRDFSGVEVATRYGNTSRNDLSEFHEELVSGFNNEHFSLVFSADYYHRNALNSSDRAFSRSSDLRRFGGEDFRSSYGNPGTIVADDYLAVPRGSNGRPSADSFRPGIGQNNAIINSYNTAKFEQLEPETERQGYFGYFEAHPFQNVTLFMEGYYQNNRTKNQLAADLVIGQNVPATNPFNPFGTDVAALYRLMELGPRLAVTHTETARLLAGVRISNLPQDWEIELAGVASESKTVTRQGGSTIAISRVQKALDDTNPDTALNVFGDGDINNRRTLEGLRIRTNEGGRAELRTADLQAHGELFHLPSGPVRLALGGQYREEEQAYTNDKFSKAGDTNAGGTDVDGSRYTQAVFYEFSIPFVSTEWKWPLLYSLDLQTSGRYERFSSAGSVFKPKFSLAWHPFQSLLVRGSYNEGFRAPALTELFQGELNGFVDVFDPKTQQPIEPSFVTGGDPNLKPETSYSQSVGLVFTPSFLKDFSLGVDYFRVDQRNLIETLDPQFVLNHESSFAGNVTRDAAGNVTSLNLPYQNVGQEIVQGLDISLHYGRDTPWGHSALDGEASYAASHQFRTVKTDPYEDLADSFALPDFKGSLSLTWQKAGWETVATVNYIDTYEGVNAGEVVASWTTLDVQASYTFPEHLPALGRYQPLLRGLQVSVGADNVFDDDPPFANLESGYDSQTHSPRGRFYYVSLRKKF